MAETRGDYEVGYKRPPVHTRFQKGNPGGEGGRQRASLLSLISKALNEKVVVTRSGKRRRISKREAVVAQLVNRSATADLRAIKMLFEVVLKDLEKRAGTEAAAPPAPGAADDAVIATLLARLRRSLADE